MITGCYLSCFLFVQRIYFICSVQNSHIKDVRLSSGTPSKIFIKSSLRSSWTSTEFLCRDFSISISCFQLFNFLFSCLVALIVNTTLSFDLTVRGAKFDAGVSDTFLFWPISKRNFILNILHSEHVSLFLNKIWHVCDAMDSYPVSLQI